MSFNDRVLEMLKRVERIGGTVSASAQAQAITQLVEADDFRELLNQAMVMKPVLRDWVLVLPRRAQGSLLTAIRSCDLSPKPYGPAYTTSDRLLTAYLRWLIMVPADEREVGRPGAFMQPRPPENWKPSEWGHYPQHWLAHVMHAAHLCYIAHPEIEHRNNCSMIYHRIVNSLHLRPEPVPDMMHRLTEDRIANGNIVS